MNTANETFGFLREAYEENALWTFLVFECRKTFPEGREHGEGEQRSGCPVTMKSDESVEKMRTLMRIDDGHLVIRMKS